MSQNQGQSITAISKHVLSNCGRRACGCLIGLCSIEMGMLNMGEKNPPYYRVKHGKGECVPSLKMRRNGFAGMKCGPDSEQARSLAWKWYDRWIEFNKSIKIPSSNADFSGHIVFTRTLTHVAIKYIPERSVNIIIPRLSNGESFASIVIVRGNKEDEEYLYGQLVSSQLKEGFRLSDEVLLEMRSAARAQRIIRSYEGEMSRINMQTPLPKALDDANGGYSTDITDDQWKEIKIVLKLRTAENPRPRLPSRETINAIIHHLRSGRHWTELPNHKKDHDKVRVTYLSLVARNKWDKVEAVLNRSK